MKSPIARILYTEDDADTRELVTYVLTDVNFEVVAAEDYDEALRLARAEHFDLYVIDTWMPGASGIDLCKQLREFDSQTPILFYFGAAYDADKQRALASGAQGYVTKPADSDELIAEVLRLVSAAKS
ncbi:MAG: response regulator [Acidobacteria bacterium]|nr:response regulator [Acidobacteriota bacterium]